jgi:hypothetical protein
MSQALGLSCLVSSRCPADILIAVCYTSALAILVRLVHLQALAVLCLLEICLPTHNGLLCCFCMDDVLPVDCADGFYCASCVQLSGTKRL